MLLAASLRGLLDFETGEIWSHAWERRSRAVVYGLMQEAYLQSYQLQCRVGMAQITRLHRFDDTTRQSIVKHLIEKCQSVLDKLLPWATGDHEAFERQSSNALMKLWERGYGKLDDPEVQAKIAQTEAALLGHTKADQKTDHLKDISKKLRKAARSLQELDRELRQKSFRR